MEPEISPNGQTRSKEFEFQRHRHGQSRLGTKDSNSVIAVRRVLRTVFAVPRCGRIMLRACNHPPGIFHGTGAPIAPCMSGMFSNDSHDRDNAHGFLDYGA